MYRKILSLLLVITVLCLVTACSRPEVKSDVTQNTVFIKETSTVKRTQGTSLQTSHFDGPYTVITVIDGDTIMVKGKGEVIKVRLIGVDTPESVARGSREKDNCPEGRIASDFTKSQLLKKTVYLEYDMERTDRYGRTLAYVYLKDQCTMFNRILLKKGYAKTMIIAPNDLYEQDFKELERTAKKGSVGFWDDYFLR